MNTCDSFNIDIVHEFQLIFQFCLATRGTTQPTQWDLQTPLHHRRWIPKPLDRLDLCALASQKSWRYQQSMVLDGPLGPQLQN